MKIDLKRQYRNLYTGSAAEPALITVPRLRFLAIDGQGDPDGPEFQDAVGTLYGLTYSLKFAFRDADHPVDFSVMPLEGLWWCEGMQGFDPANRERWRWTLMILLPDCVVRADLKNARATLAAKRGKTPALSRVKLTGFREGQAVQMLHIGPYSSEPTTIQAIDEFIHASELEWAGKHHEIYLSDPRKTAPEKLKTILRAPVRKARKSNVAKA